MAKSLVGYKPQDYSVTCHNYTTGRERYKQEISDLSNQLTSVESSIAIKKVAITNDTNLLKAVNSITKDELEDSITVLKISIKQTEEEINNLITAARASFDNIVAEKENLRLIYQMLKDENLEFFKLIMSNSNPQKFIDLIDSLNAH